jgi:uncharacterized protein YndB with AHSA1/START domain
MPAGLDSLMHRLDRRVVLNVPRELVFRYLTETDRWARWWGEGSTIDAKPGGALLIRLPGGIEVAGHVKELSRPASIVFTYGFRSGSPIPEGGSLVSIGLKDHEGGTKLRLAHTFATEEPRNEHVQGWRYQLAVLGNVTANEAYSSATQLVDAWFSTWSDPDAPTRDGVLDRIASPDIEFRDQFSLVMGVDDLRPHLAAVHKFMPGTRLTRDGAVRHCQGIALADWIANASDGTERGRGTNIFVLAPGGRIQAVTGFWNPAQPPT